LHYTLVAKWEGEFPIVEQKRRKLDVENSQKWLYI
jgi:hypothetical protein